MRKLRLREIGSDNYEMAKPRLGPLKTNFVTDLQWVGDLSMGQWVFCLELKMSIKWNQVLCSTAETLFIHQGMEKGDILSPIPAPEN